MFESIEEKEKENESNQIEEADDIIELGKLPAKKYIANKEIFKKIVRMEESSIFLNINLFKKI